jgi:hypothetical protein
MTSFEKWWSEEGSAMRPMPTEDVEEFAKRIAEIAWSKRAYKSAAQPQQEPFGYFRADAFCWTDCAETDENAKALYEYPFK